MEINLSKLFNTDLQQIILITLSVFGIYFAIIIFTRIFGKRSFSKMSSFDFAMTVAIGSIIATTVLTSSVTLINGVIALFIVYLAQITAALCRRHEWFRNLIDNTPLLLMDGEKILEHNLKKARVAKSDLRSKLREANVIELSEVKAVVFETTGDISVLHTSNEKKVLNNWMMEDVERKKEHTI